MYPGAANPFGGGEWEAHFGASTIAFGDEAFHDWLLEQVCEGCALSTAYPDNASPARRTPAAASTSAG